jgi:hypothetical protein
MLSASVGIQNYGAVTIPKIIAFGKVGMEGTTVLGETKINGFLTANHCHLKTLEILGRAELLNCQVLGKTTLSGSIVGNTCTFSEEVEITSENSEFKKSSIKSIKVLPSTGKTASKVFLKEGTTLLGDIEFVGTEGIVSIDASSSIGGRIIGGHKE